MVEVTFKVPIYKTKVKLVVCDDINKYAKENNIDSTGVDYYAIVYEFYDYPNVPFDIIVLLPTDVKSNTIVHEAFHIAVAILRKIGCNLTESSEEAYAYLNEWLYTKIVKTILEESSKQKQEE